MFFIQRQDRIINLDMICDIVLVDKYFQIIGYTSTGNDRTEVFNWKFDSEEEYSKALTELRYFIGHSKISV